MAEERKRLGQHLIKNGVVTQAQLDEAVREQGRTKRQLGEVLLKLGYVKEEDLAQALSDQLGFTFIDLSTFNVNPAATKLVPAGVAKRLTIVPLFKISDNLTVAMRNPLDLGVMEELERITKLSIRPVIATGPGIGRAIEQAYGAASAEAPTHAAPAAGDTTTEATPRPAQTEAHATAIQQASEAPVITLINQTIQEAIRLGASDVHLEPQDGQFLCRYRVDGILQPPKQLPVELQSGAVSRIKIMANMDIAERRLPQDGRIQLQLEDRQVDLRIGTFPTIYGEHVAIRVLDKTTGVLRLMQLGFTDELLRQIKKLIVKPYGILLVTGPTGSGKTTTLYGMLQDINDERKNILTLEDPVEYTIAGIHQSQVNVKAGLTFAMGLRSMLRLDPDIIMIGEIRDRETAEIAIQAALTGHLVFSTLHTNDAASACSRLTDIGVEPYLVASSLTAVLAQRLVRKLCQKCRQSYHPTNEERDRLAAGGKGARASTLYKEKGCKACSNSGFAGRAGIHELLLPDDAIKELIVQKASAATLREAAKRAGMIPLHHDGLTKVVAGLTSLSEVLRVTEEA